MAQQRIFIINIGLFLWGLKDPHFLIYAKTDP
jgi:hypothetical protein